MIEVGKAEASRRIGSGRSRRRELMGGSTG